MQTNTRVCVSAVQGSESNSSMAIVGLPSNRFFLRVETPSPFSVQGGRIYGPEEPDHRGRPGSAAHVNPLHRHLRQLNPTKRFTCQTI
jgi:hypothetical protein